MILTPGTNRIIPTFITFSVIKNHLKAWYYPFLFFNKDYLTNLMIYVITE